MFQSKEYLETELKVQNYTISVSCDIRDDHSFKFAIETLKVSKIAFEQYVLYNHRDCSPKRYVYCFISIQYM